MLDGRFLGAALNFAKIESEIVQPLLLLLFSLASVYFLYGVFVFMKSADDEKARTTGREHMLYGVIGIAIMVSVYGILNVVCKTLSC